MHYLHQSAVSKFFDNTNAKSPTKAVHQPALTQDEYGANWCTWPEEKPHLAEFIL